MAVSISISTERKSYDASTNCSTILVKVTANYNAGSYNNTGEASGTVTINGTSYDFTASFGSPDKQSGSSTIYSTTVVLDHNVTSTITCSASFSTGVSSGTVRASRTATYSSGSSSDGEGEDDGGDEGLTEKYDYIFIYDLDEKVALRLYTGSSIDTEKTGTGKWNWKTTASGKTVYIEFLNEEDSIDYDLIVQVYDRYGDLVEPRIVTDSYYESMNGKTYFLCLGDNGSYTFIARIAPKASMRSFVYIEADEIQYTAHEEDCTFNGHAYLSADNGSSNIKAPSYSTTSKPYIGRGDEYATSPKISVYFLKFTTPDFAGFSENIEVWLTVNSNFRSTQYINYWLTSSDSNYAVYVDKAFLSTTEVIDPNILTNGIITVARTPSSTAPSIHENLLCKGLEPNKTYFLILEIPKENNPDSTKNTITNVRRLRLFYNGKPILNGYNGYDRYNCYIDNGQEYEAYAVYIDNGYSWEICN